MSVCTAANTAPNIAVNNPSDRATTPHHQSCVDSRSRLTRRRPYMAVFSITPLIKADTGDGAAG